MRKQLAKKDKVDYAEKECDYRECKEVFKPTSSVHNYCCIPHRRAEREERRKDEYISKKKEKPCGICGKPFMPNSNTQKYHLECAKEKRLNEQRLKRKANRQTVPQKTKPPKATKPTKPIVIKEPNKPVQRKKKYTLKETIKPKEKAVKKAKKVIETVNGGFEDNLEYLFNDNKKKHELVSRPYTSKESDMIEAFLAKSSN